MTYILILFSLFTGGTGTSSLQGTAVIGNNSQRICQGTLAPLNTEPEPPHNCYMPLQTLAAVEFASKEACESAAEQLGNEVGKLNGMFGHVCVPKG